MSAILKQKTYLQAMTDEVRHELHRGFIKHNDDLVVVIEPEELIRFIDESTGQDQWQYAVDGVNSATDKERDRLNVLFKELLRGRITIEQQQEFNALLCSMTTDYALRDVNARIERELRPS